MINNFVEATDRTSDLYVCKYIQKLGENCRDNNASNNINNDRFIEKRSSLNNSSKKLPLEELNSTNNSINAKPNDKNFFSNSITSEIFKEYPKEIIEKEKHELILDLKKIDCSLGDVSIAEQKIIDISKKYSFNILGEILQSISLEYCDEKKVLCEICESLERFDIDEVQPWGPYLLLSFIFNKDDEVKAYGVSLLDNWLSDRSLLKLLKNIDTSSSWLKEYIDEVIKNAEE